MWGTKRVVVAGLVAVVVALVAGWVALSAYTARSVDVAWSESSPTCSGAAHRGSVRPVVDMVPGTRCTVVVKIANDGPVGVHLGRATAGYLGSGTGGDVQASNADGTSGSGIDAVFDLDRPVGPGQTKRMSIQLHYAPKPCSSAGTTRVSPVPVVEVRVLGISHRRAAPTAFSFRRDGRTPLCQRDRYQRGEDKSQPVERGDG